MLTPKENTCREMKELGGMWEYSFDWESNGLASKFNEGFKHEGEIPVPASWNELFTETEKMYYLGDFWYQKKFFVSQSWKDKRVMIRIGSVHHTAEVWVNGKLAGGYDCAYLPFEFDISNFLNYDAENIVVVKVNVRLSKDTMPVGNVKGYGAPGAALQTTFPDVAFDFFPYGGIHRPVVLYTTSKNYLDDITVTTDIKGSDGFVNVSVELKGNDASEVFFEINEQKVVSKVSDHKASVVIQIENANFWSDKKPSLYELKIKTVVNDNVVDDYSMNVGVRTIEVKGTQILLNGEPVYLQGFGKHEDFPIIGKGLFLPGIVKDYELMKWIGANSFRTTHYPYAEEILDLADKLGFLVISETSAVGLRGFDGDTSEMMKNHKNSIKDLIKRDKNRPSVIMWCLANEPDSQALGADTYFKEIFDYSRPLDTTRPYTVVTCDGPWVGRGECRVMELCDVIALNRYYGWYVGAGRIKESMKSLEEEFDSIHEKIDRPMMMTEFGADCVAGQHALPSFVFSEEYQSELIEAHLKLFRKKKYMCGEHIWNFADFMTGQTHTRVVGNKKGVFTRERQPKLSAHTVRKIWKKEED